MKVMATVSNRPEPDGVKLTTQQLRNRNLRNIAIGLCVALLVVLFYAITIVKVGPGILRPEG